MTLPSEKIPIGARSRGVTIQRTFRGLEARLHSIGKGRFFGAAFLGVWLAGWAAGEVFAVWLLGVGGWSLLTGRPPEPGRAPLEPGPSVAIGAFLVVWLALWTFGGIAALHEFFRLLWSVDRLAVSSGELAVARKTGFFTRRTRYPRESVRRLYRFNSTLMLETAAGSVELTQLGTPEQQDEIIAQFSAELSLASSHPPLLPANWEEISAPEGGIVLVPNLAIRRRQAAVAWAIALPLCAAAIVVANASIAGARLLPLVFLVTACAGAATWGAWALQFGRPEWRVEKGRIVQQRRSGSRVRPGFTGTGIHLSESRDSDGDTWYLLEISTPDPTHEANRAGRLRRRRIITRMNDATEPRRLAEWLAMKSGLPLDDSVKATPTAASIRDLVGSLENCGRLGRAAAKLIARRTDPK
jgi:hypothetical protein